MAVATGVISAVAAVAGAGATIINASKGGPKLPKMPALPKPEDVLTPDSGSVEAQRRRRAALAGRGGTILTGPTGLGTTGTAGAAKPPSTLLGS